MKAGELVKSIQVILLSTILFSILLGGWIGYLFAAIFGFASSTAYAVIKHVVLKIPYSKKKRQK
jgi:hypothetical protein